MAKGITKGGNGGRKYDFTFYHDIGPLGQPVKKIGPRPKGFPNRKAKLSK